MSHKHRVAVTCPGCGESHQANAAWLLEEAAQVLSACAAAGLKLRLRHGILECEEGFILPLDDGSFTARTREWSPFSTTPGDDLDDLGRSANPQGEGDRTRLR